MVVLPWSTWAMIATLRRFISGSGGLCSATEVRAAARCGKQEGSGASYSPIVGKTSGAVRLCVRRVK
ncbi:hypothetical protein D3C72_1086110 [compost metagenome]